ncbi:MRL1, partial [Symbiodinium sp. CCMP2456]
DLRVLRTYLSVSTAWCFGVCGFASESEATSFRFTGPPRSTEASAPLPKRAPVLAVKEVAQLERAGNSRVLCDSVVSEGPPCMLLARARASDAARVFPLLLQVSGDPWATVWMQDSAAKAQLATSSRSRPLLPLIAPAVISQEEITRWQRSALASAAAAGAERLSSLGPKASCPAWAPQTGVGLVLRRLLAHHVREHARSTVTYSRHFLTLAARVLEEILIAIRDGNFSPDRPLGWQLSVPDAQLNMCRATGEFFALRD